MMNRQRQRLATPHQVIERHGGELPFWMAWTHGELDAELQAWFRQQAATDPQLHDDLGSIEQPDGNGVSTQAVRDLVRHTLEATNYLVEDFPEEPTNLAMGSSSSAASEQTETDLAFADDADSPDSSMEDCPKVQASAGSVLRRRIRSGLFAILDEIDIRIDPAQEAAEGSQMLHHLVGQDAVACFRRLHDVVEQLRGRVASPPLLARERMLQQLAPKLFEPKGEQYPYHLSYRLFLRARLLHYCRRRGWQPSGARYHDLASAFDALSRERIGEIIRQELVAAKMLAGVVDASRQVLELLETAP